MSRRYPNCVDAYVMCGGCYNDCSTGMPDGSYKPARPEGFASLWSRIRLAWLVFTGRADALVWPGQGDK